MVHVMHSSMKITYIFTLIFQNFNVVATSEFSFCYEINIRENRRGNKEWTI
jgi:hypothetical protein